MKTKTINRRKARTFGELMANFYKAYGSGTVRGIRRLLIKAELVGFRGGHRYVLSRGSGNV
jgi:hypothetical protein